MTEPEATKAPEAKRFNIILYPIFVAIFPVLSLYSVNLAIIPMKMIARPLFAATLASLLLWGIFSLVFRDWKRAAAGATSLLVMSYLYSAIQKIQMALYIIPERIFWVWLGVTLAVVAVVTWKFKWHRLLNVLASCLMILTVCQIGYGLFSSYRLHQDHEATLKNNQGTAANRPDIIYVILDGYGRSDALKRALSFENNPFIKGLQDRGFFVAKDSHANYCQTELSVGSSLNLDFIPQILNVSPNEVDRAPLDAVIDRNEAAKYLREKGYRFEVITTGFPPLMFDSADVNLQTRTGMSMIEAEIVQLTPFAKDSFAINSLQNQRREGILNAFDELSALSVKSLQPRFVVAHILAPHPPFVFGPKGEPLRSKNSYGFWDGSDYLEHVSNATDYRNGYVGQAEFIGSKLLQSIDALLSTSGEKPVILIQGDHGSKLRLDQNSLAKTDLNECFPNLMAYYSPEPIRGSLYDSITPVNSFRLVFNGLFGAKFPLLPDKSWYSTRPLPYQMIDVTDRLVDHSGMDAVPIPR